MKTWSVVLACTLGLLRAVPGLAAETRLTLQECYDYAIERSETVAIAAAEIDRAAARHTQALGTLLPRLTGTLSESLQERPNVGGGSTFTESFTRTSRPEALIGLTQPLFQGFKEFAALKMSGADRSQQAAHRAEAARLLYRDVAAAFYLVARVEQELGTTERIIRLLRRRAGELREWVGLGKAREGELAGQEADIALLEAEAARKRGERRVGYEILTFLTGLDPHPPIRAVDPTREGILPLAHYVAQARQRPDVEAAAAGRQLAGGEVAARRADLLPRLDAAANYYPYRVGYLSDVRWEAKFTLSVPILNFGAIGQLKEARTKAGQAALQAGFAARAAEGEIRRAHAAARAAASVAARYAKAVRLAEAHWARQAADFRLGLVTNLDVLMAQRTWLEGLRSRDSARAGAWLAAVQLSIAAGLMP